ncbi:hypothetical protein V5738_18165 [Salinisphaera sp. SPP-AMP-43]|uniref:toxin-antitoxin system YwqK family antitoxin n=1 Tax=Salinisphaera sp. SPP-AMP-43 TaxID=3121288 RepID=UPI003C6E707F
MKRLMHHPTLRGLRWFALGALLLVADAQAANIYWLDLDYEATPKDKAAYKVTVGDEQQAAGWPLSIDTVDDGGRHFRGFINARNYMADDTDLVGPYTRYRPDDHSKSQAGQRDDDGELDGKITNYRRDGSVKSTIEFSHGQRDGTSRCFDAKGRLSCLTEYVDGKREGVRKTFVRGTLFQLSHYHDDKMEGVVEKYTTLGDKQVLVARSHFHNDRPDGWFRAYSAGQLTQEVHYRAGHKDGTARYFYSGSDQLRKEGHYADGKRVGTWRQYSRTGKPYRETVYADDGSQEVVERSRFDSKTGQRIRHERIVGSGDDRRRVVETYERNGYLRRRLTRYLEANRSVDVEFDRDGRLTYRYDKRDGHGVGAYVRPGPDGLEHGRFNADGERTGAAMRTDRDGDRIASLHFKHDQPDGEFIGYDDAGRIDERGDYAKGKRVGHWQIIDHSHALTWQGEYRDDKRYGHWQVLRDDGPLRAAGDYDDQGEKQGIWVIYDADGQLENCPRFTHGERGDTPDFDAEDTPSATEYCRDRLPNWAEPQV